MAGSPTLTEKSFPDVFQYVSVTLGADTVDTTGTLDAYIMYCESDTVVDAAFMSFTTVDTSNDATFALQAVPQGTGPEGSGTAFTNSPTTGATADSTVTFTITETANIIPAGSRIALKVSGTSNVEGVNITLRIRTRIG